VDTSTEPLFHAARGVIKTAVVTLLPATSTKEISMLKRTLAVALIALSLIAIVGCASVQVEDEHGSYGVSSH
jgi:hypothetical protein